jgi:glycosyltransferase involved in cell wall biosynthesis
MKVLIVSGIWPPDVGGPASHAPELARWLRAHGHAVEVLTTAASKPAAEPYDVHWVSRRLPPGARHAAVAVAVGRHARGADVVYATSMVGRTAVGCLLARRPFVAKLTSDVAFERSHRRTLGEEEAASKALRRVRDWSVRRAAHIVCPSEYIAELAAGWRGGSGGITVLPNPAPDAADALPVAPPATRPLVAFAGRLTAAKNVDAALHAVELLPDATLVVIGDGEERQRLEQMAGERVRFVGARPRGEVLGLLAAADVAVLPSAWENFPHAAVEALAMGTPVVATRVGGVPEIIHDGENGVLVDAGDDDAFAEALARVLADDALRQRLAQGAARSVSRFAADAVYGELERILAEATR